MAFNWRASQVNNVITISGTISVIAEWALWGKAVSDRGYRLLDCSDGSVSADSFTEVITRYSPGTLDNLPQVTISWFSDPGERIYLAVAIHNRAENGSVDADGREIVFTRYFCVPYEDLAAGAVGYQAMYEEFSKFTLTGQGRIPIKTKLATPSLGNPSGGQAMRVAALLLTGKPVCIVGADQTDLLERLRFLDTVVSLLPYGMRCRLSASTWASSTLQTHKFRLFFASAPRPARDQQADLVVEWGLDASTPIGHNYADDYLKWLEREIRQPMSHLASQKQQIDFSQSDVLKMLETVGIPARNAEPSSYNSSIDPAGFSVNTGPIRVASTEHLIMSLAKNLSNVNIKSAKSDVEQLRSHLDLLTTAEQRSNYRNLIKENRLLRECLPMNTSSRAEIYEVLLRIAFDVPLTYVSYREIEACAGYPDGRPLHKPLLETMERLGSGESIPYLLVLSSLVNKGLTKRFYKSGIDHRYLITAIANPELLVEHARILCDITIQFLREHSDRIDLNDLQIVLSDHGYLAQLLDSRHSHNQEYQLDVLTNFLNVAHGARLDRSATAKVLGSPQCAPSIALFAAVIRMVDPEDIGHVMLEYSRNVLGKAAFPFGIHVLLMQLLSGVDQPVAPPTEELPLRPDDGASLGGRGARGIFGHLPSRRL